MGLILQQLSLNYLRVSLVHTCSP